MFRRIQLYSECHAVKVTLMNVVMNEKLMQGESFFNKMVLINLRE